MRKFVLGILLAMLLAAAPSAGPATAPPASAAPADTLALLAASPRPVRDPVALVSRLRRAPADAPDAEPVPVGPIERAPTRPYEGPLIVGRRDTFFVLDQNVSRYVPREAELRIVSERAYWYVEVGQAVSTTDLARSADHFDRVTYPTVRRYFGSEASPGIDGDPRISVFLGNVPGVGAYFSNWDEYPRSVFPYSNEREMVHVNVRGIQPGSTGFDGTLAHEFQHMVHWNGNPADETWVDEGFAELASALAVSGRWSGAPRLAQDPDLQLTTWGGGSTAAQYQASHLFARYFLARFGDSALRDLLALGGRPNESFDRYLASIGSPQTFDDLFGDWVVANMLDDPTVADGRYAHDDLDHRATVGARVATAGPPLEADVRQYGADYVELTGDGRDAVLGFEGDAGVRLVGAEPTSGRALWWSNRGDGMDTSMTRRFDLRTVSTATLTFNLWLDTERDYDFLYVMASDDGGQSWRVLPGTASSAENGTGNAVGPGYSGRSGQGPGSLGAGSQGPAGAPGWLAETVDLSPFVGREILVRFEYVTDQATNFRGALVDDVRIDEIGYADDAEGDTGWVYDGFLRSDNTVPQSWGLRLVEYRRGGRVVVRPLRADAEGRVTEALPSLGGDLERAVLAVSGLAPRTLEPARYRVSLAPLP